jgi:2,4-dienoyl-CoA reductase-like NADH-dependent reductase (Old Yellow Enzyme family)
MEKLWESVRVGHMTLQNRLAMAPMTRGRSTPAGVPTELVSAYYRQRASFGLIVTEGTQPFYSGGEHGYMDYPVLVPATAAESTSSWVGDRR